MNPKTKTKGMDKTTKTWLILGCVVSVIGLTSAGIWMFTNRSPDPKKMSRDELRDFRDSDEFANMDDQQRRQFMREAMMQRFTQVANEYHELPENEKTRYLDERIDEMLDRMGEMKDRPRPERREGERRHRSPDPEQMRTRSESIPAETRGKLMAFREDMQKRMNERGIEMPGPGGRGR